jgi:hypothetical protein
MYRTRRKNENGEVEVAICPVCKRRVEFIGAPMVRCYSTGDTYEQGKIMWVLESEVLKETGYDVENIRGNDRDQDFLPNANPAEGTFEDGQLERTFASGTISQRDEASSQTRRRNEAGEVEVAICPVCKLRIQYIGAPMVRCYSTGDTYEPEKIMWVRESNVSRETGYDVENIRGNDIVQDFLPNASRAE